MTVNQSNPDGSSRPPTTRASSHPERESVSPGWRTQVATLEECLERIFRKIDHDARAGDAEEMSFFVLANGDGLGFEIVSLSQPYIGGLHSHEAIALLRGVSRALRSAVVAVQAEVQTSKTVIAIEYDDFTICDLATPSGVRAPSESIQRRPMTADDYPLLQSNWRRAVERGWWGNPECDPADWGEVDELHSKTQIDPPAVVAFHEAGHAVAFLIGDIPFLSVTIEPTGEWLGHVDTGTDEVRLPVVETEVGIHLASTTEFEAQVVGHLAGPVAEARFLGFGRGYARFAGLADNDNALALLRLVTESPDAMRASYETLLAQAQSLVWDERTWAAITAIAAELQSRRTLSYEEVVGICRGIDMGA